MIIIEPQDSLTWFLTGVLRSSKITIWMNDDYEFHFYFLGKLVLPWEKKIAFLWLILVDFWFPGGRESKIEL